MPEVKKTSSFKKLFSFKKTPTVNVDAPAAAATTAAAPPIEPPKKPAAPLNTGEEKQYQLEMPPNTIPGSKLKLTIPGMTEKVIITVPPGAVPGSTISFSLPKSKPSGGRPYEERAAMVIQARMRGKSTRMNITKIKLDKSAVSAGAEAAVDAIMPATAVKVNRHRSCCCCSRRTALVLVALIAASINLHHMLMGATFMNALFSSHLFASLNLVVVPALSAAMRAQGVPIGGNRSEVYAHTPSGRELLVDVYEPPPSGDTARPAVLYFHAGAYNSLGRELCGGHLCWVATHGVVGFSASYRLTNGPDGAGVAGCIEDAWTALAWMRDNSHRLGINPKRIAVWGDSAGGGLALALGTGLRPWAPKPAPQHELPRAVLAGFPVTTFGAHTFLTHRGRGFLGTSRWLPTPAMSELPVANLFVPASQGLTAEASAAAVRAAFAGGTLFFGQRWGGLLLPAANGFPVHDDAASISPLSLSRRRGLPPMMVLSAADDTTVPLGQQERFVEEARAAGNAVAQIIFAHADHGEGGVYTPAGREATLRFLGANGLLPARRAAKEEDGVACLDGARNALGLKVGHFPKAGWRWFWHKRRTMRLAPRDRE